MQEKESDEREAKEKNTTRSEKGNKNVDIIMRSDIAADDTAYLISLS